MSISTLSSVSQIVNFFFRSGQLHFWTTDDVADTGVGDFIVIHCYPLMLTYCPCTSQSRLTWTQKRNSFSTDQQMCYVMLMSILMLKIFVMKWNKDIKHTKCLLFYLEFDHCLVAILTFCVTIWTNVFVVNLNNAFCGHVTCGQFTKKFLGIALIYMYICICIIVLTNIW